MNDNRNVLGLVPFTDDPLNLSTSGHFPKEESTQDTAPKDIASKHKRRLALRNENQPFTENHASNMLTSDVAVTDHYGFFNSQSGYHHNISNSMNVPDKEHHKSSDPKFIHTRQLEDVVSRLGKPDFIYKEVFCRVVPTSESAMNVHSDRGHPLQIKSAKDNFVGDHSSYERNVNKTFRNECLSNDQIEDRRKPFMFRSDGISESLQKNDRLLSTRQEERRIEKDLSSNGKGKDRSITNITELEIAHQLLALKDGLRVQSRNPYFIDKKDESFSSRRKDELIKNDVSSSRKSEEHYIPNTPTTANQLYEISEAKEAQVQNPDTINRRYRIFSSRQKEEHIKNELVSSGTSEEHYIPSAPKIAKQISVETHAQYLDFIYKKYSNFSSRRNEEHIKNDVSSSGKREEHYIPNAPTIAKQLSAVNETQVGYPDFIDKKYGSFSNLQKRKHIKNDVSSSEKCAGQYIPNTPTPNQLYAISETNDTQIRYPEFIADLSIHDSYSGYLELYTKTQPENYDFAMNIMAYIEELNDCSWKETISYFDEYVKKMFKYMWNKMEDFLKNKTELETFDRSAFLDLMSQFTQSSKNRKYNLSKFLNYCVLMSQLGITAKKFHFKDAPKHIIFLLRDAIKEMEDSQSMFFEINVKKYAKDFVEVLNL